MDPYPFYLIEIRIGFFNMFSPFQRVISSIKKHNVVKLSVVLAQVQGEVHFQSLRR
jgi:hypothetical protein